MRQYLFGFLSAAVVFGAAGAWMVRQAETKAVRWPLPQFYDQPGVVPEAGFLHVSGSLIGKDMSGLTFMDITCSGGDAVCRIVELKQFGPYRQINIWNDESEITSWEASKIVAESSPPESACNRVRLVFDRKAKSTRYIRIPNVKADKAKCASTYSENDLMEWTLGEQPL